MNSNDILDMVGDAKGTYVWDAQNIRSGSAPATKKKVSAKRTLLIAAMIALMLLLVGCTIAYVQGWFVTFFANKSEAPLSDSQIELIEENEQQINEAVSQNGWTVELRSALMDNNKAYIIIGITAPEGVDLEPEVVDDVMIERFSPGNDSLASDMDRPPAIVQYPKGVMPSSMQMSWQEDGDGKDNTKNYVMEIEPNIAASSIDPFGANAQWKIHIENIVRTYDDEEYKQELLNTKYKGDYGVMFTHEETQRMKQQEVLVEGIWDFTVTFTKENPGQDKGELLKSPIITTVEIPWRYGEDLWNVADVRKDITVTSILLEPFSVKVSYEPLGQGWGWPNIYFDDGDLDHNDYVCASCILKDGSKITLHDWGNGGEGEERYKLLEPDSPLVLEEVQCIQMPDGTKINMDGTVEYAAKTSPPSAASNNLNNASTTDVYVYYADFDADEVEDIAIWYDGAFRAVCLLDETGEAAKTFSFEDGVDVYQTYNQRAAAIKHEPNQIRMVETENDIEVIRYFQAEKDGLHLSVGVMYDPNGTEARWFQSAADGSAPFDTSTESWRPISEEVYRRIVEDYQVMQYRLIPIT